MPSSTPSATRHPAPTLVFGPPEKSDQPPDLVWEEPHPGHRLPGIAEWSPLWASRCVGVGLGAQAYHALRGGECRNGMAAKVYHDPRGHRYRVQRQSLMRKDIRVRRPAKASVRRLDISDTKGDGPSSSSVNVEPFPGITTAEAHPRISIDFNADTSTLTKAGADVEVATTATEQTLVPGPTQLSRCGLYDVSNLLGIYEDEDCDRPASPLDPDALCPGPCEDTYGWEAELERKALAHEHRRGSPALDALATSVRRSNQGARKLIHRMFSMGPSSGAGELNMARRASTAN